MKPENDETQNVADKVNTALIQLMMDTAHGAFLEGLYESRNCKAFGEEVSKLPGGIMPKDTAQEFVSLNSIRREQDPALPKVLVVNGAQGQQLHFPACP